MQQLLTSIAAKKKRLDELRPLSPEVLGRLEHYYDIELTYTSNAIEGNTLSPVETTLVIEKGLTISGKPLKDHLEALDHYDAIRYVRELARQATALTERDVRNLHRLVTQNVIVHEAFNFLFFSGGKRLVMREVETEIIRRDD